MERCAVSSTPFFKGFFDAMDCFLRFLFARMYFNPHALHNLSRGLAQSNNKRMNVRRRAMWSLAPYRGIHSFTTQALLPLFYCRRRCRLRGDAFLFRCWVRIRFHERTRTYSLHRLKLRVGMSMRLRLRLHFRSLKLHLQL